MYSKNFETTKFVADLKMYNVLYLRLYSKVGERSRCLVVILLQIQLFLAYKTELTIIPPLIRLLKELEFMYHT